MTEIITRQNSELSTDLADLQSEAVGYVGKARAERTLETYSQGWSQFEAWCEAYQVDCLPADTASLVLFVTELARSKSVATIKSRVAAIAHYHKQAGVVDPTKAKEFKECLAGIVREKGSAQKQAKGITDAHIRAIAQTIDPLDPRDCRDFAMLLVARSGMLRQSEVVALNFADADLSVGEIGLIRIHRSKTDQAGQGVELPLTIDAVEAVRAYHKSARISEGPLFQASRQRAGELRLKPREVDRAFKRLAAKAGIAGNISGHSCRVGTAQDLMTNGASLVDLMEAGRWKSSLMPARYTSGVAAKQNAVARLL